LDGFIVKELFEQSLVFYNLPLTGLLGLVVLYWLLSLLGTVDLDTFDIDFDGETDVDGGASGDGVFGFLMRAVNAQDVPVMIIFSLLILFMWSLAILSNYYLNPSENGWIAVGLLVGNFVASALLVKAVTQPLRPLMRAIKHDQEHQEPLIGLTGTVKSGTLDQDFGQVEVPRTNGAPALLNAILPDGHDLLSRGDAVLVISFDPEKDKHLVQASPESSKHST
jgi:hypothetical protein